MSSLPFELDPDRLVLTKDQIKKILKAMIKRWQKNIKGNIRAITSGYAMLAFVDMTDEKTIQTIWGDMLKGFNDILMQNAIARAKGENPMWHDMVEKLTKKIEDDEI